MKGYEKVEHFFKTHPNEVTAYCECGRYKLFTHSTAKALIKRGYKVDMFHRYFIVYRKEAIV